MAHGWRRPSLNGPGVAGGGEGENAHPELGSGRLGFCWGGPGVTGRL